MNIMHYPLLFSQSEPQVLCNEGDSSITFQDALSLNPHRSGLFSSCYSGHQSRLHTAAVHQSNPLPEIANQLLGNLASALSGLGNGVV